MNSLWERFQKYFLRSNETLGFSLDVSRMRFDDDFLSRMEPLAVRAFEQMRALEAGAVANPDENRMVGHYWLRAPELAPTKELQDEIVRTGAAIGEFCSEVRSQGKFTRVLVIGIGGSALGPQFVSDALGSADDPMSLHFLDNTDPDGFDRVLGRLEPLLDRTLTIVISKSGGTKETRNGMMETQRRYAGKGLEFANHAVAVTGDGSELDKLAVHDGWLRRFPMWDWVGGRTSVMSAVGLVPMALQGIEVNRFLAGAATMDEWTRTAKTLENPAMLLALMWHFAGNGRGEKDMVVLPYKDRLLLFSRYLQQLVMESLGKEFDLDGVRVNQGIAVYGNKGSTDQHAYVQQLRDGVHNFFVTFVEVRRDRSEEGFFVEPNTTSGDYLQGFLRGTRSALYDGGRGSITVSMPAVTPFTVGALIALYERAVGFYGSLVNTNAYHQPGVEAGKKAATAVLQLQGRILLALESSRGVPKTGEALAESLGEDPEAVYHVLQHLTANGRGIQQTLNSGPGGDTFVLP